MLDRDDPVLRRRCRLAARLAVAVALGFLLLIPLLSLAAISDQQQRTSSQERRERLIAAGGPVLNAQAPARPLPALRAEVNGLLDQAAAQVARQQQGLPPANPWTLLPEILRNAFASFALALGFAGLAQRRNSPLSLLGDLQLGLKRLRQRKGKTARAAAPGGADPD